MACVQQCGHCSYYKWNPDEERCFSHAEDVLGVELFNVKLFLSRELTAGFSMNGDWTPPGFEFEFEDQNPGGVLTPVPCI